MKIAALRSIGFALLIVLLLGVGCNRLKRKWSESGATPTPQDIPARITAHVPDAFYEPPSDLPRQPGALLRSEPLKDAVLPAGMRGWRILYTTTVDDNTPATAVATVFASNSSQQGPHPVIAWDHGTTGLVQKCMPSLFSDPAFGIPWCNRIVRTSWVVIETDYSFTEKGGPHPYLIGEGEARATLDAVRAARKMSELSIDKRMVVWGYSQGGHAALWTGIVGPRYAPELEIVGVAAIAPPTNIERILAMSADVEKMFGPYIALAYSRFYSDIKFEQVIRPEALDAARQIVNLCDSFPPEEVEHIETLSKTFDGPALATSSNKALQARLEQNTPDRSINAPVVIAQGLSDAVVPANATKEYVEERCSAGQRLEYWTFAGRDHFTIAGPGAPLEDLLIKWTTARFANEPAANGCVRKSF
jgi:pimeloyl-ACP methyl ester carboxylesterase